MKLALALHRSPDGVTAAALSFETWDAAEPTRSVSARGAAVGKAEPGALDLRDLPVVLQLLAEHRLAPECIVFDGLVYLDAQETPGFGFHLHQALGARVAVIGASRSGTAGFPAQFEVHREDEAAPLIVTAIGIDLASAKARIRAMHGKRRLPTLLKRALRVAKGSAV